MARPILLQDRFSRMITDVARDELPPDAAFYMKDFIPDLGGGAVGQGGRLAKRGGWEYASADISATMSSAATVTAMGMHRGTGRLCFTTDNNKFGYVTPTATTVTQVSTSSIQSLQGYPEHAGVLIIPNNDGTTAPKSYDGTTFGNLAGSPPTGRYAAVWRDHTLLGDTSSQNFRTYFSATANPGSWDTTNGWISTIRRPKGYAVLQNALLIFHIDACTRVRGTIPPPGGDLVIDEPIFNIGTTFPQSIAVNSSICAFANKQGVYLTNGSGFPQDLTALCGIKSYYQDVVSGRTVGWGPSAGGVSGGAAALYGGFVSNYYILSATYFTEAPGTPSQTFMFDTVNKSAWMLGNFIPSAVAMTPEIGDELYFAMAESPRIFRVSPILLPDSSTKADADNVAIAPELHTRYYSDYRSGRKRWRHVYLDYYLEDAASDNPTLAVSYSKAPVTTAGSYTSAGTLSETTADGPYVRAKLPISVLAPGLCFKIAQSGNSQATVIAGLSENVQSREAGRIG